MILRKTFLLTVISAAFFVACKKQSTTQDVTPPADCVNNSSATSGNIIEGRYIIALKNNSGTARAMTTERVMDETAQLLSRNAISQSVIKNTFTGEPGGFIANLSEEEVGRLRADESIETIEPDRLVSLSTCFTVVEPRLITWNIRRVGYGNGIGKRAWIIDTGIDFEHPDLTVDQTKSRSFIPGVASADDENGHGTHVAGIIGGKNNSFGVLGVASGATLISLRVLNQDGQGLLSYIIQALGYVNSNASAGDVVNMSLGDDEGISEILDDQVRNTASRGIYIAIAAGNDHVMASGFSPARVNAPTVFTVSAIDSLDNFASFSNFGNDVVDYAAPGVRILSTFLDNRYAYMSGTSMAAPHVAGLLLLKGSGIASSGTAKNDPDGVADPIAHY